MPLKFWWMDDMLPHDCPICGEKGNEKFRPFCSKRCADRDLGLWFSESYTVPVADEEEFSEAPPIAANDDE